jgi:hypothetical protein
VLSISLFGMARSTPAAAKQSAGKVRAANGAGLHLKL